MSCFAKNVQCVLFFRGSQWTGEYTIEFRDLMNMPSFGGEIGTDEPRYSFILGGYAEDHNHEGKLHSWCQLFHKLLLLTNKAIK